jgi:hypothetical protein
MQLLFSSVLQGGLAWRRTRLPCKRFYGAMCPWGPWACCTPPPCPGSHSCCTHFSPLRRALHPDSLVSARLRALSSMLRLSSSLQPASQPTRQPGGGTVGASVIAQAEVGCQQKAGAWAGEAKATKSEGVLGAAATARATSAPPCNRSHRHPLCSQTSAPTSPAAPHPALSQLQPPALLGP